MAFDLTAVIRLRDDISGKMRKITQVTENLSKTTGKVTGGVQRFTGAITGAGRAVNDQVNSLGGLRTGLLGIAGAYVSARGAASLFKNTVGEAMQFESSKVLIEAMINDKQVSDEYMKMVERIAIDSPILDSQAMFKSSKAFVSLTKDIDVLESAWKAAEKLSVLAPEQGVEGAVYALKELASGDVMSLAARFEIPRKVLHDIKNLPFDKQIDAVHKVLEGMNMTDDVIQKMGSTTMARWQQVTEKIAVGFRNMGTTANSEIGKALGMIDSLLEGDGFEKLAGVIDKALGKGVQAVVNMAKGIYEFREPILAVAKVVGVFIGAVVGIAAVVKMFGAVGAAIGFLTSPLGIAAAAVTGIVFAFQQAYEKSEAFRTIVNNLTNALKSLFAGNLSGSDFLSYIGLSQEQIAKFQAFFTAIKTKAGEFVAWLGAKWQEIQPGVQVMLDTFMVAKDVAIDVFTSLWNFLQPIFSALGVAFQVLADVAVMAFNNIIAPAVSFVWSTFQTLWAIVGPILELLGAAIGVAFGVLKVVWDTILKPVATFLLGQFKDALESIEPIVNVIGDAFGWLGDKISSATDWFKGFADKILNFQPPEWLMSLGSSVAGFFGGGNNGAKKASKGHYHGLPRVPYDGYLARLHKGEMVLPRGEAEAYRNGALFDGVSYERAGAGMGVVNNEYHGNTSMGGDTTVNVTVNYQGGNGGSAHSKPDMDYIARELALQVIQAMEAGA